jgi:competence protein ComEC
VGDRHAVLLAIAACAGAWFASGPSAWVGLVLVVLAFAARRPLLVCLAVAVLAAALAADARAGLVPPPTGAFAGPVTLLSDPAPDGTALRADARLGPKHVQVVARGAAAAALADRLAGETIDARGVVRRLTAGERWLEQRHIVASLTVDEVTAWHEGGWLTRLANGIHRALARGAESLPPEQRPLFLGIVLGDDRGQRPEVTDDFRGAGLSHLLAVSGQNVAFVLALAGPLLRRLRIGWRLAVTLAVIGCFALLTRFEPSVLRASAMASVAALAVAWGREASSARALALAVTVLVLADPFLVSSLGFQLSVAASVGILALAPRLARVLPGPRPLVDGLSVTLAAQAAVGPLLVTTFGGVPVASVPANLLAVPAAGPVMMWGIGAGIPAGVLGGPWAGVLHLPTRLLVGWIGAVARWGAGLPLGELGARHLLAIALGVATLIAAARWRVTWLALPALALVASTIAAPAVVLWRDPPDDARPAAGITVWRDGASAAIEVDGRADASRALEALRRAGLRRVDVVVVGSASPSARDTAAAVVRRYAPSVLLSARGVATDGGAGDDLRGAVEVTTPTEVRVGPITLVVTPDDRGLRVEQAAARARGPPV